MEGKPFVSIVMPVRNAVRTMDETFQYLFKLNYPRDRMEIIIADGGSDDGTVDVVKNYQKEYSFIKLVEIPDCPSPGFARNKALDKVEGEYVFFTDGDCAPSPEWINIILNRFQSDAKIGGVGGEIYTHVVEKGNLIEAYCEQTGFLKVAGRYWFLDIKGGYYPEIQKMTPSEVCGHRAFYFATANAAYRKDVIDKLQLKFWSEKTGEDIEFSLKVRKAGYKLYFEPEARVDHMHRASLDALRKVWVGYGKGHPVLVHTHAKKGVEIVLQNFKSHPGVFIPFPMKAMLYLGNFHWMHIMGLGFIVSLLVSVLKNGVGMPEILTGIFLLLTGRFIYKYFKGCFQLQPKSKWALWCKIKYLTNWAFVKGALLNFWQYKVLYIEPSF